MTVEEPTTEEAIAILYGLKDKYEAHHGVIISDESIKAAAHYSQRFISSRSLPDKAIDLLDEACSKVAIFSSLEEIEEEAAKSDIPVSESTVEIPTHVEVPDTEPHADEIDYDAPREEIAPVEEKSDAEKPVVTEEDIAEVVHAWTGIPVSAIAEEETRKLLRTEEILGERVMGQEKAIESSGACTQTCESRS